LIKESRERVELGWSAGDAGVDGDKYETKHVLGDDGDFVLRAASSHGRVQQEQQRTQQKYVE
jgi:hypothetical protein